MVTGVRLATGAKIGASVAPSPYSKLRQKACVYDANRVAPANWLEKLCRWLFGIEVSTKLELVSFGETQQAAVDQVDGQQGGGVFDVLVWNSKKGSEESWAEDMGGFDDVDLALLQEASPRAIRHTRAAAAADWQCAVAFRQHGRGSGVATGSRAPATSVTAYASPHSEPILKTPKAALASRYRLANTDKELLVVNVHALNFAIFGGAYDRQIAAIEEIVAAHDGPVLLAGDFNTWNGGRMRTVEKMVRRLGLAAVKWESGEPRSFFGKPLDHAFVRGLDVISAKVENKIDSSDHPPLRLKLAVEPAISTLPRQRRDQPDHHSE